MDKNTNFGVFEQDIDLLHNFSQVFTVSNPLHLAVAEL